MNGYLVLESGEIYQGVLNSPTGKTSTKEFDRAGEVVFNTSHSGYEEIATDPSYYSQIMVMTAPMQGNYGAHREHWESKKVWIEGFVSLQIQNSVRDQRWIELLHESKVNLLTEIDTRQLVLSLRSKGTVWGALVAANTESEAKARAQELIADKKKIDKDWVNLASRKEAEVRPGKNPKGPRVAVLDFGTKENILRELEDRCSELKIFPSRTDVQSILAWKPDGLMLTNGPGDPGDVQVAPETVKSFLGKLPIFGICMGHQILSIALGAKTFKLKFGHRGANHPIKDTLLNTIYMSSQNHGYAADEKTLPADVQVTHRNLNDQTVAGIYSQKLNCLGIQYHPESHPGPHEASRLFDFFTQRMLSAQEAKNGRV